MAFGDSLQWWSISKPMPLGGRSWKEGDGARRFPTGGRCRLRLIRPGAPGTRTGPSAPEEEEEDATRSFRDDLGLLQPVRGWTEPLRTGPGPEAIDDRGVAAGGLAG
jgi:hypothetical protein